MARPCRTPSPPRRPASQALEPAALVLGLLEFPWRILVADYTSIPSTFLPSYAGYGGWPGAYEIAAFHSRLAGGAGLVHPRVRPQTRLFSLVFFLGTYYLTVVLKYFPPWYLPLVELFGYLTLGLLFDQALCVAMEQAPSGWHRGWLARLPAVLRAGAAGLLAAQLIAAVCSARELRVQQALIEDGLRGRSGSGCATTRAPRTTA